MFSLNFFNRFHSTDIGSHGPRVRRARTDRGSSSVRRVNIITFELEECFFIVFYDRRPKSATRCARVYKYASINKLFLNTDPRRASV